MPSSIAAPATRCSASVEASFYVVAGYGRGLAVDASTGARVYMKMKMAATGAGLGLGLGGFASQLVILFEDDASFQRFIAEGLDATAGEEVMAGEDRSSSACGSTTARPCSS